MSPPAVSTKEFLAEIWGSERGIAELTIIKKAPPPQPGEKPKSGVSALPFTHPDSVDQLIGAAQRHAQALKVGDSGVYVGIALRAEKWPRKSKKIDSRTGRPKMDNRGTEDNALLARTAWVDIDFAGAAHKGRVISRNQANKLLGDLPIKPSCVVHTGGGIQVYWFLQEPARGNDLWKLKSINRAIANYFGTDNTADLARVFRLPGTMNPKIEPFRPCHVVFWQPNKRYILDDFEFLPLEEIRPPAPGATPAEGTSPQEAAAQTAQGAAAGKQARPDPPYDIPEEGRVKIVEELTKIWIQGYKHELALCVSGMLAYAGANEASAKDIIARTSDSQGGETHKRMLDVEDTYRNFRMGEDVKGGPSFDKTLDSFPPLFRPIAQKVKVHVRRYLPKPPSPPKEKKECDPDFDIMKIIKFESRPAKWTVIIKKHGEEKEWSIPCEREVYGNIRRFRIAFVEETGNQWIAAITQTRWEHLLSKASLEIRGAPEVATVKGLIRTNLEMFLEDRKEQPDVGELRTFPGFNESEIYFTFHAFKGHLKSHNVLATDRDISDVLKEGGWEDKRRWIGAKNPSIWVKAFSSNGNGHPKKKEPQGQLFSQGSSEDEAAKTAESGEGEEGSVGEDQGEADA